MSSAQCKEGCTTCPKCTGAANPHAPALADFRWGVMQARASERFWEAALVAHVVRGGVAARGATTADDLEVARFADRLTAEAAQLPAKRTGTGIPTHDADAATAPSGSARPTHSAEQIFAPKFQFGGTLGAWFSEAGAASAGPGTAPGEEQQNDDVQGWWDELDLPSPADDTEAIELDGRCCVRTFQFPSTLGNVRFSEPTDEGWVPWKGGQAKPAIEVSLEWRSKAEFIDDPENGCFCECCEYRQYVLRNDFTVTHGGETGRKTTVPHQDCIYVVKMKNKKGQIVFRSKRFDVGKKPDGVEGVDWWGPYCLGHRQPQGPHDPFDPKAYYPTACKWDGWDRPSHPLPYPSTFKWGVEYLGIIWDLCELTIRRIAWFSVDAAGSVDSAGKGTLDDTPRFQHHP